MTPQDYLEYLRKRYKTYAYLKYSLKNCTDKKSFKDLSNQLLEEIFEDEKMYFDFSKQGIPMAPIIKEYENVSNYSQRVMQFYTMYKELTDFDI